MYWSLIAPASRLNQTSLARPFERARADLGLLHGTGPLGVGLEVGDDVHDVRRGGVDGDARLGALRHAAEATSDLARSGPAAREARAPRTAQMR